VHALLQAFKQHPLIAPYLRGGELLEWGAKTIPEGGYYSLPDRLHGDGVVLLGDAAGFVEVASLMGIHYAVESGILAAHAIFEALKKGDVSAAGLAAYDRAVRDSFIVRDLHQRRNMRLAFKQGFYVGGLKSTLMTMSRGRLFGSRIAMASDAAVPRHTDNPPLEVSGELAISKVDAVFKSGNTTRDDIPSHLITAEVPPEAAEFYQHMGPAGVYERQGDRLVVNAPNCIDCKATDVLGPRWTPREGGSGPKYRQM
jgi:electron-transferring-flavoprotein dehydrogenase